MACFFCKSEEQGWFGWCSLKGGLKIAPFRLARWKRQNKEAKRKPESSTKNRQQLIQERKKVPRISLLFPNPRRTKTNSWKWSSSLLRSRFLARSNSTSKKGSRTRPPLPSSYEKGSEHKPVATVPAVARRRRRCGVWWWIAQPHRGSGVGSGLGCWRGWPEDGEDRGVGWEGLCVWEWWGRMSLSWGLLATGAAVYIAAGPGGASTASSGRAWHGGAWTKLPVVRWINAAVPDAWAPIVLLCLLGSGARLPSCENTVAGARLPGGANCHVPCCVRQSLFKPGNCE